MSLSPIVPGRIPASLLASRLKQQVARQNIMLAQLQDQIATGQRFFRPSEFPAAAARTIALQSTIERKEQMKTNVSVDRSLLNASESSLVTVSDALVQAKAFIIGSIGQSSSENERLAMAVETSSIIKGVVNAANVQFRGRYLFGGSKGTSAPFEIFGGGEVRYNGDQQSVKSFVDLDLLMANSIDGASAFAAVTKPLGNDINAALTLDTKISDLQGGLGVQLGSIVVTVNDSVNPVKTLTIDLTNAETVRDIKTILENKFSGTAPNLTVDIDPATKSGIRLTPSGGTVAVSEVSGSTVAADLGIKSAAAATVNGSDLNPRITLLTKLSDFNGGIGIGATVGNGLQIINGIKNKTVDISSAVTVEDLFNALKSANLDLDLGINTAGNGLAISSRLSGAKFSIGENNGTNAAGLGIRTLDGTTLLADINLGRGAPVSKLDQDGNLIPAILSITRRDGTTTSTVDLKGMTTIQQVMDAITAIDGNITASLNTVGNGISIIDTSGTNPLVIAQSQVSTALGIDGTEAGTNNTVPLIGKDVNPREANGVLSILVNLEVALRNGDDQELARLDKLVTTEISRFNLVRADIGGRLKVLDDVEGRLLDQDVTLQQTLSDEFDVDLTEAITQLAAVTSTLQATLQTAAQSLRLNLFSFL